MILDIPIHGEELFNYNRETFKFDQDQRLEREQLRLEMQVKRFELFREDIRDLVNLTIDRMDVYHLVGALFLEFCVVFFCEGRVQSAAPPFILSLFLLSNACAFVYLLLAVWLSMHASIAAHSFGVRLLTRFVRLPIPSPQQITDLSSNLADFEAQGITNVLRLPVIGSKPVWARPIVEEPAPAAGSGGAATAPQLSAASSGSGLDASASPRDSGPGIGGGPLPHAASEPRVLAPPLASVSSGSAALPRAATLPALGVPGGSASELGPTEAVEERHNLLGRGETPFSGEDMLLRHAKALPGLHVKLFRMLQAKWQCYDAYCRVCMALGVNQILQGLSYYCIVHTLVENRSPSAGYALLLILQAAAVALFILDVSGLRQRGIIAVQAVGTLPVFLAAIAVQSARRKEDGTIVAQQIYQTSPWMFLLQTLWLELLLWVAAPSKDMASLPRRFRSVLFLDVFGDGGTGDPTEAEAGPQDPEAFTWGTEEELLLASERIASAEMALTLAHASFRRWEAAPAAILSDVQREEVLRLKVDLQVWRRALHGELAWREACTGLNHSTINGGDETLRPWGELTAAEKEEDPFSGCLLGPFEHDTGYEMTIYYFDLETSNFHWGSTYGRPVLSLPEVSSAMRALEAAVRLILAMAEQQAGEAEGSAFGDGPREPPPPALPEMSIRKGLRKLSGKVIRGVSSEIELQEPLDRPLLQRSISSDGPTEGAALPKVEGIPDRRHFASPHLAGPHARHFVPERLPWQLLRGLTRVLQVAWAFCGTMAVLRELGIFRMDFQHHNGRERRLVAVDWDRQFDVVDVEWPHGAFFQPNTLSCLPQGLRKLLVGSPYALYEVDVGAPGPLQPRELEDAQFVPGAVALCGPPALGACLLGAPSTSGLELWSQESAASGRNASVSLAVSGQPWRMLGGAIVACDTTGVGTARRAPWCLILAGWDGGAQLPILVLPLPDGPQQLPKPAARDLRPRFAVPLALGLPPAACASAATEGTCGASSTAGAVAAPAPRVVGLTVVPTASGGRLWALLDDGALRAWSLGRNQPLGAWRGLWPAVGFEPAAVCEVVNGDLFVVGSGPQGPSLLRAPGEAYYEEPAVSLDKVAD